MEQGRREAGIGKPLGGAPESVPRSPDCGPTLPRQTLGPL
jgi:hypothetical protein